MKMSEEMTEHKLKTFEKKFKIQNRLQSIKSPRNYNLVDIKTKKVYTPNLSVARKKQKHEDKTEDKHVTNIKQPKKMQKNKFTRRSVEINYKQVLKEECGGNIKNSEWNLESLQFTSHMDKEDSICDYTQGGLRDQNPSIAIWTFPDSFALKIDGKDSECKLGDLPEGLIGKCLIRKSGKMQVHIGTTLYDLESFQKPLHIEDILKLDADNAVVLEKVSNWFTLNPDWVSLTCCDQ